MPDDSGRKPRTIDERLDQLTVIVETLAGSVVVHDNQIEAHDRQIEALIQVADKNTIPRQ